MNRVSFIACGDRESTRRCWCDGHGTRATCKCTCLSRAEIYCASGRSLAGGCCVANKGSAVRSLVHRHGTVTLYERACAMLDRRKPPSSEWMDFLPRIVMSLASFRWVPVNKTLNV